MNASSWVPLGASLISLWFAVLLFRQYAGRKRLYQLWWAISMLSYACASFGEFYALAYGWSPSMYKFYYFNAVSLVAIMAAGEMYMLFKSKIGHVYLVIMIALMATLAALLVTAVPDPSVIGHHDAAIGGNALPKGSVIRSVFPPILSGVGGLILIFGPLWSWWKSRFSGNLFIAAGAVLLSVVGRLAVLGVPEWLPLGELIGIAVIFYGVFGWSRLKKS
ncbi:hypothetical protein [Tumebacillus flagellatus]|uniref:Histidine kinase N-terminal 7TM region domain-containing protein n=1 Tax=Tumebacillus flagellatus TaxID=1157490 RepID=A0A074LSA8_9BACL|nr:hypothetical protein [Tumebacillus flagellatus]KEO83380.1 hypothetical protein EL26_10410 [Tumebacillus flagellatus]